jgi:hypothetical protein
MDTSDGLQREIRREADALRRGGRDGFDASIDPDILDDPATEAELLRAQQLSLQRNELLASYAQAKAQQIDSLQVALRPLFRMGEIAQASSLYADSLLNEFAAHKFRFHHPDLARQWDLQQQQRKAALQSLQHNHSIDLDLGRTRSLTLSYDR